MSWVEQLKPEDEVQVEIIYPVEYAQRNLDTIGKYSAAIAMRCKAAAILEEDETEFLITGMSIVQVYTVEEAMKKFGVKLTHDSMRTGRINYIYFYADVQEMQDKMKRGEIQ